MLKLLLAYDTKDSSIDAVISGRTIALKRHLLHSGPRGNCSAFRRHTSTIGLFQRTQKHYFWSLTPNNLAPICYHVIQEYLKNYH